MQLLSGALVALAVLVGAATALSVIFHAVSAPARSAGQPPGGARQAQAPVPVPDAPRPLVLR